MDTHQLIELLNTLVSQPNECEWVEFKENFHNDDEIGQTLSALSNGACLHNQPYGYLVFGVVDKTHAIVGTSFKAKSHRKGNEDFENWLINRLNPRIDFSVYEFNYDSDRQICMYIIPASSNRPVTFLNKSYIRISSVNRNLSEFPEKAGKIWRKETVAFEKEIALDHLTGTNIVQLLSTETFFDLLKIPYPSDQQGVLSRFLKEGFIIKNSRFGITKLGAILFAKNLKDFESLNRKAIRVIVYKGKNKVETEREQIGVRGYAMGFEGLVEWVNSQLPANEEIGKALRKETRMYPEIAIRELVANALIHQDFGEKGFPMIEIYSDRIEISNPGTPLVTPERFIDGYVSRNEKLADIMRRLGFCEEKGSGIDKVISFNELYQLPPISVVVTENRTRITMFGYKSLKELDKNEKIRACYQHACLKYVSNEKMTNQSLRERFNIEDQNAATASRIIRDAVEAGEIKEDDPTNTSRKYTSYVPFWA